MRICASLGSLLSSNGLPTRLYVYLDRPAIDQKLKEVVQDSLDSLSLFYLEPLAFLASPPHAGPWHRHGGCTKSGMHVARGLGNLQTLMHVQSARKDDAAAH